MGRPLKKVNEHFFDKELKVNDEELKEMYYVLATFYPCYMPMANKGVKFTSSSYELVEIVKNELRSEYAIISDPRGKSSHWIGMNSVPYLRFKLKELGLDVPKSERRFPENIPEKYISDFVRGFLDAQGVVYRVPGAERIQISIHFNHLFLVDFNQKAVQYAGVQHDEPSGGRIAYGHNNTLKIRDFVYYDDCLCPPSKKELFRTDYLADWSNHPQKIAAIERINKAKKWVGSKPQEEIAQMIGYSSVSVLARAFKNVTGQTISQYLKENK